MRNTGQGKVKFALKNVLSKISPFEHEFSVAKVVQKKDKFDFTTNLASVLYEDFKKYPGFANKYDTAMMFDEVATVLMPNEFIQDIQLLNSQTFLQVRPTYWLNRLAEVESWGKNWEERTSSTSIFTGFGKPSDKRIAYWTKKRASILSSVLQLVRGGVIVDFQTEIETCLELAFEHKKQWPELTDKLIKNKRLPGVGIEVLPRRDLACG